MNIVLELLKSDYNIEIKDHKRLERRGIVNYLYHNKPIVIINRKERLITINNWKREIDGTDEVINKYLNSTTLKYLLNTANFSLMDRRVFND